MEIRSSEEIIDYVATTLLQHMRDGQSVAWLVPGGSGIDVAVEVSKQLRTSGVDLTRLSVTLTDERYGAIGHADENWQQLLDKGFVLPGARLYRVLRDGVGATDTADVFAETLDTLLHHSDFSIGMFGVGDDGHIAGIKPHSPAVACDDWACAYDWDDYSRITMTSHAIIELDEAVIYAVGGAKAEVLEELLHSDVAVDDQPAQIIKQVGRRTLFTDYNKDKA